MDYEAKKKKLEEIRAAHEKKMLEVKKDKQRAALDADTGSTWHVLCKIANVISDAKTKNENNIYKTLSAVERIINDFDPTSRSSSVEQIIKTVANRGKLATFKSICDILNAEGHDMKKSEVRETIERMGYELRPGNGNKLHIYKKQQ